MPHTIRHKTASGLEFHILHPGKGPKPKNSLKKAHLRRPTGLHGGCQAVAALQGRQNQHQKWLSALPGKRKQLSI